MHKEALLLMLFSIAFLWGGFALALIHLYQHPDEESGE